jgi:hypothetical protein
MGSRSLELYLVTGKPDSIDLFFPVTEPIFPLGSAPSLRADRDGGA